MAESITSCWARWLTVPDLAVPDPVWNDLWSLCRIACSERFKRFRFAHLHERRNIAMYVYCDECVCVYTSVHSHIQKTTVYMHGPTSPTSLGTLTVAVARPSSAGVPKLMRFRFCGWRHFLAQLPVRHVVRNPKRRAYTASNPIKFCSMIKISKYTSWVAHRGKVCYLRLPCLSFWRYVALVVVLSHRALSASESSSSSASVTALKWEPVNVHV